MMKPIIFIMLLFSTVIHSAEYLMNVSTTNGTRTFVTSQIDSIVFQEWAPGDSMIDLRDGQKYATVVIGTQFWMAENLNIGILAENSETGSSHSDVSDNGIIEKYAYNTDTASFATYGGLYDWNEAMDYSTDEGAQGICPDGWHMPTDAEWKTLEMYLGMSSAYADSSNWRGTDQGTQLKEGGSSAFQALLSGFRFSYGSIFFKGTATYFWSSLQYDANFAWARGMNKDYTEVNRSGYDMNCGFCVRCLKD